MVLWGVVGGCGDVCPQWVFVWFRLLGIFACIKIIIHIFIFFFMCQHHSYFIATILLLSSWLSDLSPTEIGLMCLYIPQWIILNWYSFAFSEIKIGQFIDKKSGTACTTLLAKFKPDHVGITKHNSFFLLKNISRGTLKTAQTLYFTNITEKMTCSGMLCHPL